jgi:hypothetical protein
MNRMMMDRMMGMMDMTMNRMAPGMMPMGTMPPQMNMLMVPQCTMKFEKMTGGMMIKCTCEDEVARTMMQNLCNTGTGGMCSCAATLNGMMACYCNLMMGMNKCELTKDGCTIMCMSGDESCAGMIQACCDILTRMQNAGCACCLMMNNMPVCCG